MGVGNTLKACEVCGIQGHSPSECAAAESSSSQQVNVVYNQGKPPFNPYFNTYNKGRKYHPNFSYKNPNAPLNPPSYHQLPPTYNQQPPGFQRPLPPNLPQKSNFEFMMENFIATQSKINADTSSAIQQIQAHNKIIDNQMAQMAQKLSNLFKPSGQLPNPILFCIVLWMNESFFISSKKKK